MNRVNDSRVLVQDHRDRLVLGVVIIRDLKVGGLKIELGLSIDLGTQVGPPFAYLLTVDQ